MNNLFVSQPPFSRREAINAPLLFANKVLKRIGLRLTHHFDTRRDMCSLEQRINLFHLLIRVLQEEVKGDIVEVGTFTGQCALLFQQVNTLFDNRKKFHVYDSFETKFTEKGDVLSLLKRNFQHAGLQLPEVHKGYFQDTIPDQLPAEISFAHIDCGCGDDPMAHKALILSCLPHVYQRLSVGGMCVFMDYFDPKDANEQTRAFKLHKINSGVRLAVDEFFKEKPEKIVTLYGGPASHAFIRKMSP
ncbi:hypothetical protein FKX85_20830 [Echinicola soli]|uniref:O-methyltransferase n=1 Tax=Echinicola soli TaxID=2591634 RepID=A0A514CNG0_9BACT|nr:TylF/MycF/NovP-related O-methyltransferase [Echinicola soli]QDH81341.1 hypothetical protein FKX85_20830 [Echinicola soli]